MRGVFVLLLILLFICSLALAQTGSVNSRGDSAYTLKIDVDLVLLNVSVFDRKDHPVPGLQQGNFQIFEDGMPQEIRSFRAEDAPATIGLVLDSSGSMRSRQAEAIPAALQFVSSSNSQDELFVVAFNDTVRVPRFAHGAAFTNNYSELRQALLETEPIGRTALYDALITGLNELKNGRHPKKALVILSDGGDNASVAGLSEVVRLAKESTATLYTIGFYDPSDKDSNPKIMRQLARLSGGDSYVAHNSEQLRDVWAQVATAIRSQYTLGYVSTNAQHDGLFRNIKVVATDQSGKAFRVRTRAGYIAPASLGEVRP